MFEGSNIKNVYFASFNTENVTDMSKMFFNCHYLRKIDLSSFNTNKVRNMKWMFYWCQKLIDIDLSSFDLTKVDNKFEILGLSSFDASNDLKVRDKIKTIKVNKNSYEEIKKLISTDKANIITI